MASCRAFNQSADNKGIPPRFNLWYCETEPSPVGLMNLQPPRPRRITVNQCGGVLLFGPTLATVPFLVICA
jgi:hypothetical protein